ncbi:MAG: ABC transporter permease, partial [Ilumatobacteraceae bacterium]
MSKISFWLQRIAQLLIVLLLVTFGVSLLLRLIPVDLATILLPAASEGERDILRAELGFDKGPIGYYLQWLGNFVQGDFGKIYFSGGTEEVSDHLKNAMPRSLLLMIYTQVLSLAIAIP